MNEIVMIPVVSSNVEAVGHDAEKNILQVEFCQGMHYQYDDVTKAEFDALMATDSKGGFIHQKIKPWKVCRRVS